MTEPTENEKREILANKLAALSRDCLERDAKRAHLVNLRDDLMPYLPDDLEQYHGLTITNGEKVLRQSNTNPARMTMRTL